jgi:hypothetical protein
MDRNENGVDDGSHRPLRPRFMFVSPSLVFHHMPALGGDTEVRSEFNGSHFNR